MKKLFMATLFLVVFVTCSMMVFAAVPTSVINQDGSITTSGSDPSFAGKQMTLIVIKGSEITAASIMYIDQVAADANGAYSFENYLTKEEMTSTPFNVYVGGETLNTPFTHTVRAAVPILSGTVIGSGLYNNASTVQLLNATTNAVIASTTTDEVSGEYSFLDIASGSYKIKIIKPGYLTEIISVTYSGVSMSAGDTTLLAGDTDSNNKVDVYDYAKIVLNYKSTNIDCDFNSDGIVNMQDLVMVIVNFAKVGK